MENEWEGSLAAGGDRLTLLGLAGAWVFGAHRGGPAHLAGFDLSLIPSWAGILAWALGLGLLIKHGIQRRPLVAWLGLSFFIWYTDLRHQDRQGRGVLALQGLGLRFLSFWPIDPGPSGTPSSTPC